MADRPYLYETIVFRFDDADARRAFLDRFLPLGALGIEPMPGVFVSGMALYNVMTAADAYFDALQEIADGRGDAWEIANDTLDRTEAAMNGELANTLDGGSRG